MLKWYKEEGYDDKKYEMYDTIKATLVGSSHDPQAAWQALRRKWIWSIDAEECIYMLLILKSFGLESIDWIQTRFEGVSNDSLYER